jgi:23S rRNA (uridine2552-2'-O)-methyltransferase
MKRPISEQPRWTDHYTQQAKAERFPARSIYKLKEIQQKFGVIQSNAKVLDLGCFPGSWLLYAADLTKKRGQVVGIDLKPLTIQLPAHVTTYTGDILSINDEFLDSLGKNFNVVLSDVAPDTTGKKDVDAARSFQLCRAALSIAQKALLRDGSFVCKIFQGRDFKEFSDSVKASFKKQKIFKPQSSRKASKEIYIIGMGKI